MPKGFEAVLGGSDALDSAQEKKSGRGPAAKRPIEKTVQQWLLRPGFAEILVSPGRKSVSY